MNSINRVALVTGSAGNGIGRSIALTLANKGVKTVINYRTSKQNAEKICSYIKSIKGESIAICADILDQVQCKKLVNEIIETYGRLDICIIGPGAGWNPESPDKLKTQSSIIDFEQELKPIYNLFPLILPIMYKQQYGRIIGMGMNPDYLSPAYSYNVAKFGRTNALELAYKDAWNHGVTINTISPGPVEGFSSFEKAVENIEPESMKKRDKVNPQDVAEIVSFLCSDRGRYVSGNTIKMVF
jgi:NAD(P)-dependent dehydrogenase (short-subunit alcohol dehydrogenase family)